MSRIKLSNGKEVFKDKEGNRDVINIMKEIRKLRLEVKELKKKIKS